MKHYTHITLEQDSPWWPRVWRIGYCRCNRRSHPGWSFGFNDGERWFRHLGFGIMLETTPIDAPTVLRYLWACYIAIGTAYLSRWLFG